MKRIAEPGVPTAALWAEVDSQFEAALAAAAAASGKGRVRG